LLSLTPTEHNGFHQKEFSLRQKTTFGDGRSDESCSGAVRLAFFSEVEPAHVKFADTSIVEHGRTEHHDASASTLHPAPFRLWQCLFTTIFATATIESHELSFSCATVAFHALLAITSKQKTSSFA
jgi:hypothetical protein